MAKGMTIIGTLKRVWTRLRRRHQLGVVHSVLYTQEVPDELGKHVYVVGSPLAKRVIFACPCGCGEKLNINLMRSIDPCWQLRLKNGSISLMPSVWIDDKGCGSHFLIDRNRVIWVEKQMEYSAKKVK